MQFSVKKINLSFGFLCLCCLLSFSVKAQDNLASKQFHLKISYIDEESTMSNSSLKIIDRFSSQNQAIEYLKRLPVLLHTKGYIAASVDSILIKDTLVICKLYLGKKFIVDKIDVSTIDKSALNSIGYNNKKIEQQPFNLDLFESIKEKLLQYYENNGYPFASIALDSFVFSNHFLSAKLQLDKGILYHLDSIRVFGTASISRSFLQQYLMLPKNSIYQKNKLESVDRHITELPFISNIKPSDITMLGTGAILNLYIQPKKCSQFNVLLGLQPASGQSDNLQLTGNINFDLKNLLGTGENFIVKWQQYQPKSPRFNVEYQQPFIFRSRIGIDFLFDLLKKDSSFIQINTKLGIQCLLSTYQSGNAFIQIQNNTLLSGTIDTNDIKHTKALPANMDAHSVNLGIYYNWSKTNYKLNPRSGNELVISGSVGVKNININSDIAAIRDPSFNYLTLYDSIRLHSYQIRINISANQYFPMGKSNTFKLGVQAGLYNSPNVFKNDLFQIGGNKLLRGFDEESIYATNYGVFTAEYRIINAMNSYVSFFTDYGIVNKKYTSINLNNTFLSAGLGVVYETKIGILNVSYAIGKRNDVPFNLRESSKIHVGYINYF